nr:response regulator [Neorhizobium galegae]
MKQTADDEAKRVKKQISDLEEDNARLQERISVKDEGRPRVLIVEPEKLIALDLEQMLKRARYDVIGVARTKQEAMTMALVDKPDIIVTEVQLADGSSGIDLINAVYPLVDCFAIFVTAYPERLLTGNRPHPVELITKPFSPDDALAKIVGATQAVLQRRAKSSHGEARQS